MATPGPGCGRAVTRARARPGPRGPVELLAAPKSGGDLDAFLGESSGRIFFFENLELGPGSCADGLDNDFDGEVDHPADPGCSSADDPNERSDLQCDNGVDDDVDGQIDWRSGASGDPQCTTLSHDSELCPALPLAACTGGFEKGLLLVDERKAGNEQLIAKISRGPALDQADFGDAEGTPVALCLYDQTGALAAVLGVDRAGAICGDEPCWTPMGGTPPDGEGFVYKDKTASADGVRSIQLKGGGAGKSRLAVKASNAAKKGQTALPTGIAAALIDATEVTLQLNTDASCFETTLSEIQRQESDRFKAK